MRQVKNNYLFSPDLIFATTPKRKRKTKRTSVNSPATVMEALTGCRLSPCRNDTIFTLTVGDDITDADGYPVVPPNVLINDNDADGLPDDWEVAYVGLDPGDGDETGGQG